MNIVGIPMLQYVELTPSHTSTSGTNVVETWEGPINYFYKGLYLIINQTAETGTATLTWKLQMYNTASAEWMDIEGAAGDAYADGETGNRYLLMYPGLVAADADNNIVLNTDQANHCGSYLPRQWRAHVTIGGTTVTSTYSLSAQLLP